MNKVLITGEMRSGTTFLANFINSQEECVVYADFLRSIFANAEALNIENLDQPLTDRERNVLLSSLIAEYKSFGLPIDRPDNNTIPTVAALFDWGLNTLTKIEKMDNPKVVGVKQTRQRKYFKQLLDNGFKIIYIYRDPRDVFISAKNRFSWYKLFSFSDSWKESVDNALNLNSHKNCCVIKYEDLIHKNPETISQLEDFLGIKINLELKQLSIRNGIAYNDNSSFGDVKKLFDTSALYRWKSKKQTDEVLFANMFLSNYLKRLNYEPSKEQYKSSQVMSLRRGMILHRLKRPILKILKK